MNGTGPLSFDAVINNSNFKRQIDEMQRSIRGFSNTAVAETQKVDSALANVGRLAAGAFAFTQLAQLPGQIVRIRGEFQQLEIAFTTMLKSKSKADKLLAEIVKTAATTPFSLKEVATGAKQLLAYGSSASTVVSEIKTLGDVAAGVSVPIGELIYLYGTLRTQGRAYAVDIRQFAGRGIPIYEELAKVLKINSSEVANFVEAGKVGFKEVEQAFKNMTSNGGIFEGLTEKTSKSLTGLLSNLGDAIDRAFNKIGEGQEGLLASGITTATGLVDNYQKVLDILTVIITTYGAYKAAVLLVNAVKAAEATQYGVIAAQIDRESGAYAREIALKVKSAEATAARTAAISAELAVQSASAKTNLDLLRTEVSLLAVKRTNAIESAKSALAEVAASRAKLAAAEANLAANATAINIKKVDIAQNGLLIASEKAVTARKAASAVSADFLAKKLALESAAKATNTITTQAGNAASVASIAATNATAIASTRLTAVQSLQVAITRNLAAVQAAWNATLLSNPIVLFTVGLVAAAGAIYLYSQRATAAELAQKGFIDSMDELNTKKQELVSKTDSLVSKIRSETSTKYDQIKAYNELQGLYPFVLKNMTLQEFQTLKTEEAQRKFNSSIDDFQSNGLIEKIAEANAEIKKYEKQLSFLQDSKTGFGQAGLTIPISDLKEKIEKAKIEAEKLNKELEREKELLFQANAPLQDQIRFYEEKTNLLKKQIDQLLKVIELEEKSAVGGKNMTSIFARITLENLNSQLGQTENILNSINKKGGVNNGGNFQFFTDLKKTNEENLKSLGINQKGSKEWNKYTSEIARADKALEKYNTTSKSRKGDEKFAQGSLKELDQIASKAKEALEKTTGSNFSQIQKLNKTRFDAEQKAIEIRKNLEIRSFDEEVEYKRSQYELYNKWVVFQGQEAADKQFADLIKSGATYKAFLENQIATLEQKVKAGTATTQDKQNLVKAQVTLDIDNEGLDKYKQRITEIKDEVGSLTEYLAVLKAEQEKLSGGDVDKVKFLVDQIRAAEKERSQLFKQFALENNLNEAKSVEIKKYYDDLRLENDKKYIDKKSKAYQDGANAINKAEKTELSELAIADLEKNSAVYKELTKVVRIENRKQLLLEIDKHKKALKLLEARGAKETQIYKEKGQELKDLERDLLTGDLATVSEFASVFGSIGQELEGMNGALGRMGAILTNVSSLAPQIMSLMSGLTTPEQAAIQGIQLVADVILTIAKNRQQNKKFEDEYYNSIISQQNQYNLALNEQIRLNSVKNGNPYVKNYKGIISDGLAALDGAKKLYESSLDALFEGKAKDGFKKVLSFQDGLKAAMGLGAVGVISTFLFGRKDEDVFSPILKQYPNLIKTLKDGTREFNVALAETLISNNQVDDKTKELLQNTIENVKAMEEAKQQISQVIIDLTGTLGDDLRNSLVTAFRDGTSAAEAFGESVGKVLENIISQTLFSSVFGNAFDALKKDFEASYNVGGDGIITDDLTKFYQTYPALVNDFTKGLADAKKEAEKQGLDIFKSGNGSTSSNSLTGAIKGITEETAGILAGQMNAIRVTQAQGLQVGREQLLALSNISNNSNYLPYLQSIDKKLSNVPPDNLRAGGL